MPGAIAIPKPVVAEESAVEHAPAPPAVEAVPAATSSWVASQTAVQIQLAPEDDAPPPEEAPETGLIVGDDASELLPGQMRKTDFLTALEEAVCETAADALAGSPWSADDCPYIRYWFEYYSGRDAAQVQRAINLYVSGHEDITDAADYIEIITTHVRDAVATWVTTREITGLPEGLSLSALTSAPEGIQLSSDSDAAPDADSTVDDVRDRLGEGAPLDSSVRSRMSSALGADFSRVRVHTDSDAGAVSSELRARALTVGEHVAFAHGQYRPGTLVGDALIAHELAHVVQQGAAHGMAPAASGDSSYGALEREADGFAGGAIAALWGRGNQAFGRVSQNARPAVAGGLRLQRCGSCGSSDSKTKETPAPVPVAPSPEANLKTELEADLKDGMLEPPEWEKIGKVAAAGNIYDSGLSSLLRHDFDFEDKDASVVALLATGTDAPIVKLRSVFKSKVSGATKKLESDAMAAYLTQITADLSLDQNEVEGLRRLAFIFEIATNLELQMAGISEPTLSSLMILLDMGQNDFRAVAAQPGFFPIQLHGATDAGIGAKTDLRQGIVAGLTAGGVWPHYQFRTIRDLLGSLSLNDATAVLTGGGIGPTSAAIIARQFTVPQKQFDGLMEKTLLKFDFVKTAGLWELTAETLQNLNAPWHPNLVKPLGPIGGSVASGNFTQSEVLGNRKFASGKEESASRLSFTFKGQSLSVVTADSLLSGDGADNTLLDRLEVALSNLPTKHVAALKEIVIDPGNDPGGKAGALASPDGSINVYQSNSGATVPQAAFSETTAHETGHEISFLAAKKDPKFWDTWDQAIKDDKLAVSMYGLTNNLEDFAETYVLYLSGGDKDAATRARYSHRFAIMDTLF